MIIALACDHVGLVLNLDIKKYLEEIDIQVIDEGTYSLDSCNYAEFAIKAAKDVASKQADLGILVCTSGEGVAIAANKVKGIRCGIGYNDEVSHLLREHNDANMISFGAKFMSTSDVLRRVDIFIHARFEGGRHEKRVETIKNEEK